MKQKNTANPFAGRSYFIVVPGAGDPRRCWGVKKFSELVKRIKSSHPPLECVVCGSDSERGLGDGIDGVNMCGMTDINGLIELVSGASFVVANDTGTAHVANSLSVRMFCILGQGHYGAYLPDDGIGTCTCFTHEMPCRHCMWHCVKPYSKGAYPCIEAVEVDEVFDSIEKYLLEKAPGM